MRRPLMKALQRATLYLIPVRWRESVYRAHVRQNKLARRIGPQVLTLAFTMMLGTFLLAGVYLTVTAMYASGAFNPPVK